MHTSNAGSQKPQQGNEPARQPACAMSVGSMSVSGVGKVGQAVMVLLLYKC